jgi:gluconate 2-dehydrogenase gamma chain
MLSQNGLTRFPDPSFLQLVTAGRHLSKVRRDPKAGADPMTDDRNDKPFHPNRRGFLGVAAATGAASLAPRAFLGTAATTAALAEASQPASSQPVDASASTTGNGLPPLGYLCFGPDEAGFVEAMVSVMCPADALTPNGIDCGLAAFIDRQLAGGFGKGARLYMRGPWQQGKPEFGYQLPLTPEQFFKAGIAAADSACRRLHGKRFDELSESDADRFLEDISDGKVMDGRVPLASWFNELVYPLFVEACFADPIYGGNVGKAFWKMIGYPGLPAFHQQDMIDFRGKPYPGAADPKSIADYS